MNTETTTQIWMTQEDADMVQQIFDKTDEPFFTIIKRENSGADLCSLEMSFMSSLSLWQLAKQVQMEQEFDKRIRTTLDKMRKLFDDKIQELKQ